MTVLNIIPLTEVNGIRFGEKREKVRKEFGEYKEFRKNRYSTNTTDDFGDFHVFYDKDNTFEAIEVFVGEVYIDGEKIFPSSLNEIEKLTKEKFDLDGYLTCVSLSVGACEEGGKIESILFGNKNYFSV